MAESAIEWTVMTWNPSTGCDRVSPGCNNCLAPDTPLLMADMTWRPISKIVTGDQVVGFTEAPSKGQNRVYELATVEHTWTTETEAVEIEIGDPQIDTAFIRATFIGLDHIESVQVKPRGKASRSRPADEVWKVLPGRGE